MPHAPSDTTTLTILSEELARVILDDVNSPDVSTDHLVCKATSLIGGTLFRTHTIEGLSIEAAPILQSVLKHAPCEHGRRYIACAIIWCGPNEQKLVELASDLVMFLLLPCMFSPCSLTERENSYKQSFVLLRIYHLRLPAPPPPHFLLRNRFWTPSNTTRRLRFDHWLTEFTEILYLR